MLFAIRLAFSALLLIFTSLFFPEFRLGGRYLILLEAVIIAFFSHLIRIYWGSRLTYRSRGLLSGIGVFVSLFLFGFIFPGVNLTITGILVSYLGVTLLEMVLPNKVGEVVYRK